MTPFSQEGPWWTLKAEEGVNWTVGEGVNWKEVGVGEAEKEEEVLVSEGVEREAVGRVSGVSWDSLILRLQWLVGQGGPQLKGVGVEFAPSPQKRSVCLGEH